MFIDFLYMHTPFHEHIHFRHSGCSQHGLLLLCRIKTDYQEEAEALKRTQKLQQVNGNTNVKARVT